MQITASVDPELRLLFDDRLQGLLDEAFGVERQSFGERRRTFGLAGDAEVTITPRGDGRGVVSSGSSK